MIAVLIMLGVAMMPFVSAMVVIVVVVASSVVLIKVAMFKIVVVVLMVMKMVVVVVEVTLFFVFAMVRMMEGTLVVVVEVVLVVAIVMLRCRSIPVGHINHQGLLSCDLLVFLYLKHCSSNATKEKPVQYLVRHAGC